MTRSVFSRLWDAVKPPPAATRPGAKKKLTAKQKRMLYGTASVLALAGLSWGAYAYIASAPQRADKEYQAAMKLMASGNYKDAIGKFSRAIVIWPQHFNAYLERGITHRYLNESDQALADFDRAIEINPNLASAYTARGFVYRDRGDTRRALQEFTKSIEVAPNVDAYFERGQTYEDLGEHQKAIDDYDQAIAELRDAPYVYRARSLARRNLGDLAGFDADQKMAAVLEHRR
ncbi:MAG TPA: tetratricopeptide repeat protein [Bryobacteraceae bacterium]|jgi:tetratricopeptide (TPR) repeat protein|nr:tetratricopeptide repeat protein [Bryobacteraceae bacterium]